MQLVVKVLMSLFYFSQKDNNTQQTCIFPPFYVMYCRSAESPRILTKHVSNSIPQFTVLTDTSVIPELHAFPIRLTIDTKQLLVFFFKYCIL